MDEFLADLYGTNEPQNEDFEKVAHLEFLEKVADEEGIDLNDLSDEDLEELAEIAAEAMEEEEGEGEYEDEEIEKDAEAKVEEADFLGRVMAHSFNQELDSIEKEAGAKDVARAVGRGVAAGPRAIARGARRGAQAVSRGAGRAAQAAGRGDQALSERLARFGESEGRGAALGRKADRFTRRIGRAFGAPSEAGGALRGAQRGAREGLARPRPDGKLRRALDYATGGRMRRAATSAARGADEGVRSALTSQRRRGIGAAAATGAGAGGLAGGAYLAGKNKRSSDAEWDDAIQSRAWEHLVMAGLADQEGNYVPAQELNKTAGDGLDYELDAAALELLEQEGYPVEWY